MRRIELVPRVTPDSAQALWYELESGFEASPAKSLVIDAAAVRHLSAAGLQVLLVAARRAQRDAGEMVIENPSPELVACLQVMGGGALLAGDGA